MYFIQFEGTPRKGASFEADAGGAIINCWIERPRLDEAVAAARAHILSEGWIVEDFDEAYPVNASDYSPDHDGREYFEQALVDKEVFVFHCY